MKKLELTSKKALLILIFFLSATIRGDTVETKDELVSSAHNEPAQDHDAKSNFIFKIFSPYFNIRS
jgi:hypothetical protein